MKPSRGKLPLSIMAIIVCAFAFAGFLYMEDVGTLSSILKLSPWSSKQDVATVSIEVTKEYGDSAMEDDFFADEKANFDPDKCEITKGKWVFNRSIMPLYTDQTCQYLDLQVTCTKNGRPDDDYLHWEWRPDECILPRFDAVVMLERLRGKRLIFVGDSLQRGQWESFVCMVESYIPSSQKSMKRSQTRSVFKAKEYNASIEFYWAPFIIESNSDVNIVADPKKRILRIDSIFKHAKIWIEADILVFNTYIWWMSSQWTKSLWGSFANGEEGVEELPTTTAYQIALKTWANWVDSTVNPNKTRVFFTTISSTHMRSLDWHNKKGIRCYNETRPIMEKGYWGGGSDRQMMRTVASIVDRMKVPVTVLNITQLSEHRVDGHVSVYTESQGKVLTEEQKLDPKRYADCIHWCLPGVPDTWNRLFYAYL
ncbi:protein trichome birefringence-like 3 [Magnolia sinica]|uniref:protein trichome birefringence-like 3 n=1 Tax=Magnolia sinica TaxID=86752 RepID=UPI00265B374A|nr:protein trichome birefringence-like 3 [Magnolia sinica]